MTDRSTVLDRPPLAAFLRPDLHPDAMHGLAGEVATTLAAATGADPAAVLLAFLALLGNAAGPQPHAWFGGAQHPARLFAVLVGDASTGRKGTAHGAVERLMAEADPEWAETRVMYGLQSGEALVDRVADGGPGGDCRLLLVETEFARLAETMARTGTLSAHLRNAWDGRVLHRTSVSRDQKASRAHVSMVAMITPEELLKHHARLSQAGGLESRLLYAVSAPEADVSPFAAPPGMGSLPGRVAAALEGSREAVMAVTDPVSRHLLMARGIQPRAELPVSGDVTQGWRSLVKSRLPKPAPGQSGLHARAEPQVIRLAAAYALADSTGVITPDQVNAAVAMHAYCARSAEVLFGVPVAALPPPADPRHAARIVRELHDRWPEWAPRDDLGTGISRPAVAAAITDLTAKRLVERKPGCDEWRLAPPQLTLFDDDPEGT